MMGVMPLETWRAFNKRWNNKLYYKAASCWLFLLIHTTMHGSMNIKSLNGVEVVISTKLPDNISRPQFHLPLLEVSRVVVDVEAPGDEGGNV
jgi:hypothetical protein